MAKKKKVKKSQGSRPSDRDAKYLFKALGKSRGSLKDRLESRSALQLALSRSGGSRPSSSDIKEAKKSLKKKVIKKLQGPHNPRAKPSSPTRKRKK